MCLKLILSRVVTTSAAILFIVSLELNNTYITARQMLLLGAHVQISLR